MYMHLISYTYLIYINVVSGSLIYSLRLSIPLMLHEYVMFFLARAPAGGPSLPRNYARVLPYSNLIIFPNIIDSLHK